MSGSVSILQLSDPHLCAEDDARFYGIRTAGSFGTVLDAALRRFPRPDLLLLTGDLAQDESEGAYQRLKDVVAGRGLKVAAIPGNHDQPEILGRVLRTAGVQVGGYCDLGAWRVVLLSSWSAGDDGGTVSPRELARADEALAGRPDAPVLLCVHHHPVPMGSRWLDSVGLRNGPELIAWAERHPNVRGIAWGHVHQAFDGQSGSLRLLGTPSTCYQFLPGSERFALDDVPPGYRWFHLHPDGTIETGVERVPVST